VSQLPPAGLTELFEREQAEILQQLREEIAAGHVQFPGYPSAALELQHLLADPDTDPDQLVEAIGGEPTLAMQMLRIANAPMFNPSELPARDLCAGVQRIGTHLVRAAVLGFVVQQLRLSEERGSTRERCNALWRRGVAVAAIARAFALQLRIVDADAALLAGLLHVTGRLHVVLRLSSTPWLLERPGFAEGLMDSCGNALGAALLASWGAPPEFGLAILEHGDPGRNVEGPPGLTDVLAAAALLADLLPPSRTEYLDQIHLANVFAQVEPLWRRLGVTREQCSDALHKALEETQQLRALFAA
jgi:HD-like signal output (HDOD) protein